MTTQCPHCLSEYNPGARVCCHCGRPVGVQTITEALPGYFMAIGVLATLGLYAVGIAELLRFLGFGS